MPVLAALATALPYITAAWQVGSSYLNKPRKEDYVPRGGMYERYLNYLKGQTTESRVYHQRMRPALRQIGQQTQRGQRQVGYQVDRQQPGGGIEAQMRMGINQQALEAIGIASEQASIAQERVNVRTGEQLLRIGVQEKRALQRYEQAKRRWTQDMFRTVGGAAINIAGQAIQTAAVTKEATDRVIANAEAVQAKSDEAIRTDYNALPESVRAETSFEVYLGEVRDRATEITTKLVEPTKDDIQAAEEEVERYKDLRSQYTKDEKPYAGYDYAYSQAKEKLKIAKTDYSTAQKTYREDIDKYVTVRKPSVGGVAPFAGTVSQVSTAYSDILRERFKSEEKFAKDERLEDMKFKSAEKLGEFGIELRGITDPQEAFDLLMSDKYETFMTTSDISKGVTKIGAMSGKIDPLDYNIAVTGTTEDLKAADKVVTDVIKTGTSKQIIAAGSMRNAMINRRKADINFRFTQETRQTAADKKARDTKMLGYDLKIDSNSLQEYIALHHELTFRTTAKIPVEAIKQVERSKIYEEMITTIGAVTYTDGKGMPFETAKGLKRSVRKYVGLVDFDTQETKNQLRLILRKEKLTDKDIVIWENIIARTSGIVNKQALTFALEVMKRIDSLVKGMLYEEDFTADPLGLF